MKKNTNKIYATCVVLPYNQLNGNGRMYSEECAADIVNQFNKLREKNIALGEFDPYKKRDDGLDAIALTNVSHTVEALYMDTEREALIGTIAIFKGTPAGEKIAGILTETGKGFNELFVVRSRGIGEVDPSTKEVANYKLLAFDILNKEDDSFKNIADDFCE